VRRRAEVCDYAAVFDDSALDEPAAVEALAAQAWPSAYCEEREGWVLRHTASVARRRCNSALPPEEDMPPSSSVLASVIEFYRARQLDAYIQVAPVESHAMLDAELDNQGWQRDAPTDVLVAPVDQVIASLALEPDVDVVVDSSPSTGWLDAWTGIEQRADASETVRQVLARIQAPTGYVIADVDGVRAGVGLIVCQHGWAGVFCMATDPLMRRRGVARSVLRAAAQTALRRDSRRLYLQVERDNLPAQALYARAGFIRSHGYHYRLAPQTPA
jgi:ribosomal protein S18 acetylase RimI-like enzyme